MPNLSEDLHPADYRYCSFGWQVPLGNKRRPWNKQLQEKTADVRPFAQLGVSSQKNQPAKKNVDWSLFC